MGLFTSFRVTMFIQGDFLACLKLFRKVFFFPESKNILLLLNKNMFECNHEFIFIKKDKIFLYLKKKSCQGWIIKKDRDGLRNLSPCPFYIKWIVNYFRF